MDIINPTSGKTNFLISFPEKLIILLITINSYLNLNKFSENKKILLPKRTRRY